jgi:hypothetical protein
MAADDAPGGPGASGRPGAPGGAAGAQQQAEASASGREEHLAMLAEYRQAWTDDGGLLKRSARCAAGGAAGGGSGARARRALLLEHRGGRGAGAARCGAPAPPPGAALHASGTPPPPRSRGPAALPRRPQVGAFDRGCPLLPPDPPPPRAPTPRRVHKTLWWLMCFTGLDVLDYHERVLFSLGYIAVLALVLAGAGKQARALIEWWRGVVRQRANGG